MLRTKYIVPRLRLEERYIELMLRMRKMNLSDLDTDTGAGRPQPVAAEGSEKIQALPSAAPWSVDDDPR